MNLRESSRRSTCARVAGCHRPIAVVLVVALLATGCGVWVPLGPGPRVRIESDPSGAVVKREGATKRVDGGLFHADTTVKEDDEDLGKTPYVDDFSKSHTRKVYHRGWWAFPVWLLAGAAVAGTSIMLYKYVPLNTPTKDTPDPKNDKKLAVLLTSILGGCFWGLGMIALFVPEDGEMKLFPNYDSDANSDLRVNKWTYITTLPGHKPAKTVFRLGVNSEDKPIKVALEADMEQYARVQAAFGESRPTEAAVPVLSPMTHPSPISRPSESSGTATFRSGASRSDSYALVVGIEGYRDLSPAAGARADAEGFAGLAETTLGVPNRNLHLITDGRATRTDVLREINWLKKNVPAGGRIFFYFSGHGTPDLTSGDSLLLPYDADVQAAAQTGISLPEVLADLSRSRAQEVVSFVDSCFSGSGRSVLPSGVRPMIPVKTVVAPAKVALFSATAAGETAGNQADATSGGLFTRFLLKGLGGAQADMDGDGAISLKELTDWVTPRVFREAQRQFRAQNPTLTVGGGLGAAKDVLLARGLGEQ